MPGMTLITGVDVSVFVLTLSRLTAHFSSNIFVDMSCILRVKINEASTTRRFLSPLVYLLCTFKINAFILFQLTLYTLYVQRVSCRISVHHIVNSSCSHKKDHLYFLIVSLRLCVYDFFDS